MNTKINISSYDISDVISFNNKVTTIKEIDKQTYLSQLSQLSKTCILPIDLTYNNHDANITLNSIVVISDKVIQDITEFKKVLCPLLIKELAKNNIIKGKGKFGSFAIYDKKDKEILCITKEYKFQILFEYNNLLYDLSDPLNINKIINDIINKPLTNYSDQVNELIKATHISIQKTYSNLNNLKQNDDSKWKVVFAEKSKSHLNEAKLIFSILKILIVNNNYKVVRIEENNSIKK